MLNRLALKYAIDLNLSIKQTWLIALLNKKGPMYVIDIAAERVMNRRSLERFSSPYIELYNSKTAKHGKTKAAIRCARLSRKGQAVAKELTRLSTSEL